MCVGLGGGRREEITLQEWEAVKVFYLNRKGGRVETEQTGRECERERKSFLVDVLCEDNDNISRAGGGQTVIVKEGGD